MLTDETIEAGTYSLTIGNGASPNRCSSGSNGGQTTGFGHTANGGGYGGSYRHSGGSGGSCKHHGLDLITLGHLVCYEYLVRPVGCEKRAYTNGVL